MPILILLAVIFTLACGDDNKPTTPTPDPAAELIGTWTYVSNDFGTRVAVNLREYLVGQGLTASQADMVVSDVLGDTNETFSFDLTFRADGTVIVDNEQPDRFEVSGDRINFTTSDGEAFSVHYTVTDTTLTLRFPVAALLATVGLEAEDKEEAELLRIMVTGIEFMTMSFSR